MESLHERIEERETKPIKDRRKGKERKRREDVGVVGKKLTLKRKRFDETRELRGIMNKEKKFKNRSLRNTKRNREKRRKRVVNRNSGETVRKIGGKPGK